MTGSKLNDPFQWYLGKAVQLRNRSYVVERREVVGCDLSFILRDTNSGDVRRLAPLELVELVPEQL